MHNFIKLGEHYICELSNCDTELLLDNKQIHHLFIQQLKNHHLSIIGSNEFAFTPYGYTCVVLLEESHASIHVWPEHGYCAVDLFTCNLEISVRPLFTALQQVFSAQHLTIQMIERQATLKETVVLHK